MTITHIASMHVLLRPFTLAGATWGLRGKPRVRVKPPTALLLFILTASDFKVVYVTLCIFSWWMVNFFFWFLTTSPPPTSFIRNGGKGNSVTAKFESFLLPWNFAFFPDLSSLLYSGLDGMKLLKTVGFVLNPISPQVIIVSLSPVDLFN